MEKRGFGIWTDSVVRGDFVKNRLTMVDDWASSVDVAWNGVDDWRSYRHAGVVNTTVNGVQLTSCPVKVVTVDVLRKFKSQNFCLTIGDRNCCKSSVQLALRPP